MIEIEIVSAECKTPVSARESMLRDPGFGRFFTDHMVTVDWDVGRGWHNAQLRQRGPFLLDPASAVLHYGQEIFEGMKAFKRASGEVVLFRPEENAKRFNQSAKRLAMPEIPVDFFMHCLHSLVQIDQEWIPEEEGSLYLRPFMFANEAFLGVRPSNSYKFCIIASPVGPYFKSGIKPIKVWVSEDYNRASPGGTGHVKCGGNYASSLAAQAVAKTKGCDQVIFLDASHGRWIEELGGMNVFFVFDDGKITTPPLGTILPGITRDTVISLARKTGATVNDEAYEFAQFQQDAKSGRLREAFACGTAATVVPIGAVYHKDGEFQIADGHAGRVTQSIREMLLSIYRGSVDDEHGWVSRILT
jgi:branched-chain amino acid aminotransferase